MQGGIKKSSYLTYPEHRLQIYTRIHITVFYDSFEYIKVQSGNIIY
ncbi:hypothetical protein XNC3_260054 [Xenorhabdus nematophila F1]|nr:hypothetical protein XNC3_260054 [Xenorhabdus nematophila F1]